MNNENEINDLFQTIGCGCMKGFWREEQGTVSLFLLLIFAAIFIFYALWIEFARIHMAKVQTEQAIRAGARSVLSQFDPTLHQYGLYTLDVEANNNRLLAEVLRQNLHQPKEGAAYVSPVYQSGSEQVRYFHFLSDIHVLQQQILEAMKYRAPITFIFELSDKFRKTGLQQDLDHQAQRYAMQQQLRQTFDQREAALDLVWSELKDLIAPSGLVEELYQQYTVSLNQLEDLAGRIGLHTKNGVEHELETIEARIERLQDQLRETNDPNIVSQYQYEIRLLSQERTQLKQLLRNVVEYASLVMDLQRKIDSDLIRIEFKQEKVMQAIEEAKNWNKQLFELLDEQFQSTGDEQLQNVPVLGAEYFLQLEADLGTLISLFHGFDVAFAPEQLITGQDFKARNGRLYYSLQTFFQTSNQWYEQKEAEENVRKARNEKINEEEAVYEQEMITVLKRLKNSLYDCSDTDHDKFRLIAEVEQKYEQHNSQSQLHPPANEYHTSIDEDVQQWRTRAMDYIERLRTIFYDIRNEWFVYEYALTYFNHRAWSDMKKQMDTTEIGTANSLAHVLFDQEVEYLLYGYHSCAANQSAAFTELFAFRLGIRMMEEMADSKKITASSGMPWLHLLWAAAEGSRKALQDVEALLEGQEVELSSKLSSSVTLNYKDYLRLFMIIQARQQPLLIRLQTLLELNTGIGLEARATAIEVQGTSLLPIWFWSFHGDTYAVRKHFTINRTVYLSY